MKKVFYALFTIGALCVLFTSCKKEEMADPAFAAQEAATATNTALASGIALPAALTYTLIGRDKDSLVYYNDGRLAKVIYGVDSYIQYNYGFNTVIAKEYTIPNNKIKKDVLYQIDPLTGRVYEESSKVYSYNINGAIVISKTFKYEYDANGYLVKKYNKEKPLERSKFNWTSADNDLVSILFYDEKGVQYAAVSFSRYPNTEDKLKLQSKRSQLDPYLKIFGKGPKKMTGIEKVYGSLKLPAAVEESLVYSYNADGYPTSCIITNKITGKVNAFNYNYLAVRGK